MTYSLSSEAAKELEDAFAYYLEHASAKVAGRSLDEFTRAARLIESNRGLGTPTINGRLIFPLRKYPYSIIHRPSDEGVKIGAVAHQHRKPMYWKARA